MFGAVEGMAVSGDTHILDNVILHGFEKNVNGQRMGLAAMNMKKKKKSDDNEPGRCGCRLLL